MRPRHQPHQTWCSGFSPVAGIQWVETTTELDRFREKVACFSPVAGIQWVETLVQEGKGRIKLECFSPVAGIQWVETTGWERYRSGGCFSPVAGIQWVETVMSRFLKS